MIGYRNEAAFSRAFCATARKKGWFIQRIETGTTGRGVPDIYAISPEGQACWFELKRVHAFIKQSNDVPWRPGQQAWLNEVTRRKQNAFTIIAFDNCYFVIRHYAIYTHNVVQQGDGTIFTTLGDIL